MFSEAKIACGSAAGAVALVEYYTSKELPKESQARALYYERESNVVLRPDMHPVVMAGLGIAPGKDLTNRELANLLAGNRADGERIAGKHYFKARETIDPKTGEDRTAVPLAAIDFTWTPAKSISAAYANAPPAERAMIHSAIVRAGRDGMAFIEQERARARLGKGGEDGYEQGHLGWLEFNHYLARQTDKRSIVDSPVLSSDPNPHVHFVSLAAVFCESGRVGSFNDGWIVPVRMQADAIAHMRIAEYLRADGFAVEMDAKTGACEMPAVPKEIREFYSQRTRQGEERAKEYAEAKGLDWNGMRPEQQRALVKKMIQPKKIPIPENADAETKQRIIDENKTRIKLGKDDVADFEGWQAQAKALGWAPKTLLDESPKTELTHEHRHDVAYIESLPFLEKLFESRSTIQGWEVRVAAAHGLTATGGGTQADIDVVGELIRQHGVRLGGEMTPVEWFKEDGAQYYTITTKLTKERELEYLDLAKQFGKDTSVAVPADLLAQKVKETGIRFTDEQTEAINRITQTRFAAAVGVAGCGKSTLLKGPVAAWKEQGRKVYGIALGWNQADNLLDSGIAPNGQKAISVFLDAVRDGQLKLDRNAVVVVDELGLLGTHQGLQILRLQREHGMTVVALGDGKQCAPIEAGSALELSRRALGVDQIPEILTTLRQAGREVEIVILFREGRAREALAMKREDGTAHMIEGGYREAIAATADLWQRRVRETGSAPAVLTKENIDAHELALAIRIKRREMGEIGPDLARIRATDQNGERQYDMKLAVGDRVRLFKSTGARLGPGRGGNIGRNGSVLEIRKIEEAGLVLRNAKTGREGLVAWRSLKNKAGQTMLSYGDAVTINAAQSRTVPEAIVACPSGSQGTNGLDAYSAGTRQRTRSDLVLSEGAERREVRGLRPKNDDRIISKNDCWANVARNFSRQPEKSLVVSFMDQGVRMRHGSAKKLRQHMQPVEHRKAEGLAPSSLPERRMKIHAVRAVSKMRQHIYSATELAMNAVQPLIERVILRERAHERPVQRQGPSMTP